MRKLSLTYCTPNKPPRLSVCLFIYIFVGFIQFTLLFYKSLIMVVENFQKYCWIQHTNTQSIVITRKRNKLLWTSEVSESLINCHIHFICIQIFNNDRRKFSKIPLDSAYKYATRSHNENVKQIIMNERSEWISF